MCVGGHSFSFLPQFVAISALLGTHSDVNNGSGKKKKNDWWKKEFRWRKKIRAGHRKNVSNSHKSIFSDDFSYIFWRMRLFLAYVDKQFRPV